MRRLARAVGLLGMALGLVLTSMPAAHAASELTVTFTDEAQLGGCDGLGYPGTPAGTVPSTTLELCTFVVDPTAQTCVYAEVSVKKPSSTGSCTFSAGGTVKGFCGASKGEGTAKIDLSNGQLYFVEFLFVATGGTLVVTGTATKLTGGQTGPVSGVVEAVPPTPLTTPQGGSCLTSTATVFSVVGEVTATVT